VLTSLAPAHELATLDSERREGFHTLEIVPKYGFDDFKELGLLSDSGKIRLQPAQRYFNDHENYFPLLPQLYEAWRDESEYMLFRHVDDKKALHVAVKCAKRGNDVYVSRVKQRFKWMHARSEDLRFFSADDFKVDQVVKSRLLWVTLTYNTRRSTIRQAWQKEISADWNRFISAVRRRYGKVSVLRSWETSKRGYPHVHAVLSFDSADFQVFPHFNEKEGRMSYRINEKAEFESLWHSYVDIEAIQSTKKLFFYVMKYQLKVNEGREEGRYQSRTLAFEWLFRKRSYAVSGDFRKIFSDLIRDLRNSNMEKASEDRGSWELLGIFSGRQLGLHGEWFADVKEETLTGLLPDGDWRVDEGISYA
jgi:hypothetical protein